MKKTGTLKKLTALMIAALMILSAVPAAFADAPADWEDIKTYTQIILSWPAGEDGTAPEAVYASPLEQEPGSFYVYLSKDIEYPLYQTYLTVRDTRNPEQTIGIGTKTDLNGLDFDRSGVVNLEGLDVGDTLYTDSSSCIYFQPDGRNDVFKLYVYRSNANPAVETPAPLTYTITWLDSSGEVIGQDSLQAGDWPSHDPVGREPDAQYTYTFAGWSPEIAQVSGDAAYTAKYDQTVNSYTVTWLNDDDSLIESQTYEYGAVPSCEAPTKNETEDYTYTFAGWSPDISAVTGNATYKATYSASEKTKYYTITWLDANGEVIGQDSLAAGDWPSHDPVGREPDAQYTYTFAGWSPEIAQVSGDAAYTAKYDQTVNSYTVTWLNDDDSLIESQTYEYGAVPSYEIPTKNETEDYTYTFAGWSPEVGTVTGNATYKAVFNATAKEKAPEEKFYEITWVNYDGSEILKETLKEGTVPSHDAVGRAEDEDYTYTFAGWDPEITAVSGDQTYRAVFNATAKEKAPEEKFYEITWVNYDGSEILKETLKEGTVPSHDPVGRAEDEDYTYTFAGWDPEITAVSGDQTYKAVFNATAKEKAPEEKFYEITWVNYDGSEILKETLKEGTVPSHDPVGRAEDGEYTYTFVGWEPDIEAVSGDRTYTAVFNATAKVPETVYYTITWLNDDGNLIDTTQAEAGTVPVHGDPAKAGEAGVSYVFTGWDPAVSAAAGDATYKATFSGVVNSYRIVWLNDDRSEIDTTIAEYGTVPEHADAVKTSGNGHIYTFKGWTPAVTAATEDAVYTAVFNDSYTESAEKFEKGEYINRYGITNAKVNFRSGPSTSSGISTKIEPDRHVYMIENVQGSDKKEETWTRVRYEGKEGYLKSEFISVLTEEESSAYDQAQASPAPVYTATPEPEKEKKEEPTEKPEEKPTEKPEPTEEPAKKAETLPVGEYINRWGVINSASGKKVNMRSEPDKGSKQLDQFSNGKNIYVLETVNGSNDGRIWAHIIADEKEGYIRGDFVDVLSESASKAYDDAQPSPAPVYPTPGPTIEPTDEPTVKPTETPTEKPTEAPTEEPTAAPTETPTEKPTETPTEKPTEIPTEAPTEAPTATPTEKPTEKPTEAPTATPTASPTAAPTETPTAVPTEAPTATPTETPSPAVTAEPVQRTGYAVTIGEGVYVRDYPNGNSAIIDELPVNKVVYVTGQKYDGETAWHVTQYDGKWGYVRGDMLRMMNEYEVLAYLQELEKTPEPAATNTPAPFNADSLSCYGYVSADSVNFRKQASTQSERISRLKKYALCLIYDTQTVDNTTWYKVGYEGTVGYVNGDYFKQMTVSEAEKFFQSKEYLEGLNNNATEQQSTGTQTQPKTTGTPSGIVSAEDQKVQTWTNPDSGVSVSYVPFDPFATPEPLPENNVRNKEYLDSLAERIRNGSLKEEDLQKLLETAYRDSADKDTLIESAMTYVREKIGSENTAEPTATPEDIPLDTEENPQFEQEQNQGSGAVGWIIGGVLLAAAGGGGYYYYSTVQKKRQAAQRLAQKKAAQQRKEQAAGKTAGGTSTGTSGQAQTPGAQQAARVRSNTARTGGTGGTAGGTNKPYSRNVENPYGRYTSGGEEDASYTASFKPDESKKTGSSPRRRNSGTGDGEGKA